MSAKTFNPVCVQTIMLARRMDKTLWASPFNCLFIVFPFFFLLQTWPLPRSALFCRTQKLPVPLALRGSYPEPGQDPAFESLISARCLQAAPFVSVKRFVKHTRFPGFEPGFPNRLSFPLFSNDPNLFQGFYAWFSSRVHRRNVVWDTFSASPASRLLSLPLQ